MRNSIHAVAVLSGLALAALLVLRPGLVRAAPPKSLDPPKDAPEYEAPPRPSDGANMALTVEKLEHGFDPPRPLLIWAIGSSFTNGLGNGDALIGYIRARWPEAPPIEYKKMAGCSTSYHYLLGWARHLVVPDQPDVVLCYNFGKTDDMERLLIELRKKTTADILVASLHWCKPHTRVWPDPEAKNNHQDPPALRAVCEKYGVEFVEGRRELTEYMLKHDIAIEDMLADSVHQTRYGAQCSNKNIARHFHRAEQFNYDPRQRERRYQAESPAIAAKGDWQKTGDGTALTTASKGAALQVSFTGNRIDLIGLRQPGGGTARVFIDGVPADEADVYYVSYVQPDRSNAPKPPMPPRDRCPHLIDLGPAEKIVPQEWTITMTSDEGDYRLVGSVTGPDGEGNSREPFTSDSGQIGIDPEYWRAASTNREGDRFSFEVYRCAVGEVDFADEAQSVFRLRLVQNLPNREHTLRLIAQGDGEVTVDALDVFEPPLK
jgi:hypothetical protein